MGGPQSSSSGKVYGGLTGRVLLRDDVDGGDHALDIVRRGVHTHMQHAPLRRLAGGDDRLEQGAALDDLSVVLARILASASRSASAPRIQGR
jgi:hypothetical protein